MSFRNIVLLFLAATIISCGPGFVEQIGNIQSTSDRTYGYTASNPIKIGYFDPQGSIQATYFFLSRLRTPAGKHFKMLYRVSVDDPAGTTFRLPNRFGPPSGGGILDLYVMQAEGSTDTTEFYFDIYREDPLEIPFGLDFAKSDSIKQ